MVVVRVVRVSKSFGATVLFRNLSFDVGEGELVAIKGPNGSGKTTLLKIIAGIIPPTTGYVEVMNTVVKPGFQSAIIRRRFIGFSFQEPLLIDSMTALENVVFPHIPYADELGMNPDELRARAMELLAKLGLGDKAHVRVGRLSSGERKRVDLARALVKKPKLLLADEPTSFADPDSAKLIRKVIIDTVKEGSAAIVTFSGDDELLDMADRIIELRRR